MDISIGNCPKGAVPPPFRAGVDVPGMGVPDSGAGDPAIEDRGVAAVVSRFIWEKGLRVGAFAGVRRDGTAGVAPPPASAPVSLVDVLPFDEGRGGW